MRIAIYGAGAVGGNFAVRLSRAGHDVSVVVRGDNLRAIVDRGLTLEAGQERWTAQVRASDDPAALGPQDLVITTLKTPALPAMAERIAPLLGRETPVVFAQNGIPWWYGVGAGARLCVPELDRLDPSGALQRAIGARCSIGAVVSSSNTLRAPAIVTNDSPARNRLVVGEIDDRPGERVPRLRAMLEAAGIASPATADIRQAVWTKLIANLRVSILSFLTGRTSREVFDDPDLARIVAMIGDEALAIAEASGVACAIDPRAPAPGHHSSMQQDHDRGRPTELEALLAMPLHFARATGVAVPVLTTLHALAAARQRMGTGAVDVSDPI